MATRHRPRKLHPPKPTRAEPLPRQALTWRPGHVRVVQLTGGPLMLAEWNRPDDGVLLCRARAGTRRSAWLVKDLHVALGAVADITGWGKNYAEDEALLLTQLVSRRITDVVVDSAELLDETCRQVLVDLTSAAGTALWLGYRSEADDTTAEWLKAWTNGTTDVSELDRARDQTRGGGQQGMVTENETSEPRRVPDDDVTSFLTACAAALRPEELAWVWRRWDDATAAARNQLADEVTVEAVAELIEQRYALSGTAVQFIVDVRATQAVCWQSGWLLRADTATLTATARECPSPVARSAAIWQRLRCYRDPQRGAVCALVATGQPIGAITALTVEAVAADGTSVELGGDVVPIEAGAHEYLAGVRLTRLAAGALGHDPLLVNIAGEPITDRAVADFVTDARRHTGLVVTSRLVRRAGRARTAAPTPMWRDLGLLLLPLGDPLPRVEVAAGQSTATPLAPEAGRQAKEPTDQAALDGDGIHRRRLALGLSRRRLAEEIRTTAGVIAGLESGTNHREQEWRLIARLADVLGVTVDELRRHPAVAESAEEQAGPDDRAVLGAALHEAGVLTSRQTLCEVLGWTLARVDDAIAQLTSQAPTVGLRVQQTSAGVRLVPAVSMLPRSRWQALARAMSARTGLPQTAAQVLHTLIADTLSGSTSASTKGWPNAERVALGQLLNAGLVAPEGDGAVVTTETLAALGRGANA